MDVEAVSQLGTILPYEGSDFTVVNGNSSGLSEQALYDSPELRQVANQLATYVGNARSTARSSMFQRNVYTPPANAYEEMNAARHAVRYDSIVSGVQEITEAFAFQGTKWESQNQDEADVFNQLAASQELDSVIRRMWLDEFSYSQTVVAKTWGWYEATPRGKTDGGNKKKKKYKIWAPVKLSTIDSLKVVPVGISPLGGETLAWQATVGEIGHYQHSIIGDKIDPLMATFFQGVYQAPFEEAAELARLGVNPTRLLIMNPQWVFRHTATKPDHERFANNRIHSIFQLLDLKQQLMLSDRASLVGNANYILLIRKGTDQLPAKEQDVVAMREQFSLVAQVPVIISDHRLTIDIIAPVQDFTLTGEKYDLLDRRMVARLIGSLAETGTETKGAQGQEINSVTISRVMENRRHMLKRTLEKEIAAAIVNHPKNKGIFELEPNLVYTPRRLTVTMESAYTQALLALRTQREMSRETILEFFGLDQSVEAMRMEEEERHFNKIFKTQIPFTKAPPDQDVDTELDPEGNPVPAPATPNGTPEDPSVSGGRGGRPAGGGKTPINPEKIAKPRTKNGNPGT